MGVKSFPATNSCNYDSCNWLVDMEETRNRKGTQVYTCGTRQSPNNVDE